MVLYLYLSLHDSKQASDYYWNVTCAWCVSKKDYKQFVEIKD